MKQLYALFIALALLLPAIGIRAETSAALLINSVVTAYGGRECIEKANPLYAKGAIDLVMSGKKGTYKRWLLRPGMLRVETEHPGSKETRILRAAEGWRSKDGSAFMKAEGYRYDAMLYQYRQLDLPYYLLHGDYKAKYQGASDKGLEVLDLADKGGGSPMRVYIEPDTHLIVRASGFFNVKGTHTDLTIEFGDFRKRGCYTLPYRLKNSGGGVSISTTQIEEYSLGLQVEEALFSP